MAKRRKIVKAEYSDLGPVGLPSWVLECGHYTFLRDAKDAPKVGDVRLCRRCS